MGVIDPLNFSESGWWGKIFSEMRTLIPILIGLLVMGCGKKNNQQQSQQSDPSVTKSTAVQPLSAEESARYIEAEMRKHSDIDQPTAPLTKADFERVGHIILSYSETTSPKKITDIKYLAKFTNVEILELDDNYISDLTPLAGLKKLEILKLNGNQIADLRPLAGLEYLEELYLNNNRITDLRPLSGLKRKPFNLEVDPTPGGVEEIWLNNNQITDLSPLSELNALQEIHLEFNKISDLAPLLKITSLEFLYIRNNPNLTESEVRKLRHGFRDSQKTAIRGIHHDF